jgi:hypothetical protein
LDHAFAKQLIDGVVATDVLRDGQNPLPIAQACGMNASGSGVKAGGEMQFLKQLKELLRLNTDV